MSLNESQSESTIAGIILCGGHSQRMGQDKASLQLGDQTFLQHISGTLRPICKPVVLVGRADQRQMFSSEDEFVTDLVPDAGPLAGLVTGLDKVRQRADLALVVACDTPLIQSALVRFLVSCIGDSDAAIPWDGEHLYGLTAVYRTGAADLLRKMLDRGQRKIQNIAQAIRIKKISLDEIRQADPNLDSLLGCNTPEEYQMLIRRHREIKPACS